MNEKTPEAYEATDLSLMVGSYLQGYNMDYDAECSFVDTNEIQQNCTKDLKLST